MENKENLEQEIVSNEGETQNSEETSVEEVISEEKEIKSKNKKETVNEEELSEDELYAKIQTEKLLKRKQNKKMATFVGMCFAFVLAVVVIVLAAVPVSLKPRCVDSGFASVALFPGTTNGVSYTQGEDGYKEFMKYYDKSFSQSYISAIFSGSLYSYDIEEKYEDVNKVLGTSGELISNNTYYVRLRYAEEQVFTHQNGKAYVSNYSNSKWADGKLTFTDVYVVVNNTSGFQKTEVYVVVNYPDFDENGNKVGTKERLITITVKANTYEIFNAWSDLTK